MFRVILTTFVFFFCLSWAEVKVEKVLETTSIKEYNQWVKKNKAKYTNLKPYYLKVETVKWGKEYKVYYYNENGDLRKVELLEAKPGKELYIRDFPYDGKIMLVENDVGGLPFGMHTIKNEKGEELFSFEWGFDYVAEAGVQFLPGGAGILRAKSYYYNGNPDSCYAELLSWNGKIIGRIENLCNINIGSTATPNGQFMVLNSGSTGILVKDGKELWRRLFVMCISDNGQYLCVGDSSKMHFYHVIDSVGIVQYSFGLEPERPGMIHGAFSPDNKYLALYGPTEVALYENRLGKLVWKKNILDERYKREVFMTSQCIILADLGQVSIYNLEGQLLTTIKELNSNNWEVHSDLLIIDIRVKAGLHKVIYKLN